MEVDPRDMEIDRIYCEDCNETMKRMDPHSVDLVLTSPFYNTNMKAKGGRTILDGKGHSNEIARYDKFIDVMDNDQYSAFTVNLFGGYGRVLKENGVVLYNISYGNENNECLFLTLADILRKTDFTIADVIVWKKKSALPACLSPNKLTRITEFVFVFCRKSEYMTFHANKKCTSTRPTGQRMYENIFNFIEAANNDGPCKLNGAAFSTELCTHLMDVYAPVGGVVYDSFMGTGTTGVAAKRMGLHYIGSEISEAQCEYARKRIDGTHYEPKIFD